MASEKSGGKRMRDDDDDDVAEVMRGGVEGSSRLMTETLLDGDAGDMAGKAMEDLEVLRKGKMKVEAAASTAAADDQASLKALLHAQVPEMPPELLEDPDLAITWLLDCFMNGHPMENQGNAAKALALHYTSKAMKERVVSGGAVDMILTKLKDKVLISESVSLLASLVSEKSAAKELNVTRDLAIKYLMSIAFDDTTTVADNNTKGQCFKILFCMCKASPKLFLRELGGEEGQGVRNISKVAMTGDGTAQEYAHSILEELEKGTLLPSKKKPRR